MQGFLSFIREQGVVGLAVGFILGGSVSKVVSSLVDDIINPILGIILGKVDLTSATFTISRASIRWGSFVSVLIDFAVVAAVVYYVVKGMHLDRLDKKEA